MINGFCAILLLLTMLFQFQNWFFPTNMVVVDFYLGVKVSPIFQLTATKLFPEDTEERNKILSEYYYKHPNRVYP